MNPPRLLAALAFARKIAVAWILFPLGALALPLWNWPIPSYTALFAVVGMFAACFWLGCVLASTVFAATKVPVPSRPVRQSAQDWILGLGIAINFATLFWRAGFNPLSCGDIMSCSNDAYQAYVAGAGVGADSSFEYIRIGLSPLLYGALGFALWGGDGDVAQRARLLRWLMIGSEVIVAVATGTSRNIGNVLLFALFVAAIQPRASGVAAKPISLWTYVAGAIAVVAFLSYFALTQLNRDGAVAAVGLQPFGDGYVEALSYTIDSDSFVLKGFESIARYLASGYFCLAVALDLPTGLTFPFGSSMFLARRAITATGDDSYVTMSLPGQMESLYHWSYTQQWQSLFSWLLSDYGYLGSGLIMVGVGFFFISAIGIALTNRGILAKLGVLLAFIMVVYVPANNQVFQTPETYVAFIISAVLTFHALLKRVPRRTPA